MFARDYLDETIAILRVLDPAAIEALASGLAQVRAQGGRLFVLGVGGSAGHAGHAVNDFRKLCDFEAYAPTDNVSELTARINDEGFEGAFAEWLRVSNRPGRVSRSQGEGRRWRGPGTGMSTMTDKPSYLGLLNAVALAESNAQQVTNVRKIIEGLGLEIATPDDAREILGLKGADKVDF